MAAAHQAAGFGDGSLPTCPALLGPALAFVCSALAAPLATSSGAKALRALCVGTTAREVGLDSPLCACRVRARVRVR